MKLHVITSEELKECREQKGISQRKLSTRSGVSQSMIARIESETANPTINTVKKIVDILNMEDI